MNDPWDVKSVRQSGQYVSCMKINGVPLLPPVLSKECHKEMQYYKLLAREVEKRIAFLKPYATDSDTDSSKDKTDAPELPDSEESYELPLEDIQAGFNVNIDKITAVAQEMQPEKGCYAVSPDYYKNSSLTDSNGNHTLVNTSKKFVIDLSVSINEAGRNVIQSINNSPISKSPPIELPERDYDSVKSSNQKELLTDVNTPTKINKSIKAVTDVVNFRFQVNKDVLSDPFPDLSISQEGPSSLSSKSFTGSLIDIHTESKKDLNMAPKLIRQRSYTLLEPSPQLRAHLEVQSINTGVDMSCISMSESMSNINTPNKKRRSWDLETAKVKWSSMALELNQKNMTNPSKTNGSIKCNGTRSGHKKVQSLSPPRSKSAFQDKPRRGTIPTKATPKSEPTQKPRKTSPVRTYNSNRTITREPSSPKTSTPKKDDIPKSVSQPILESEDPASRVRELYEKVHKQQLMQMAALVEKQKREQLLLQQVFDEQNSLLCKQLKNITPKSPIEVKEAWADKDIDTIDRGPVSLSQLINHKTPEHTEGERPLSTTLTETKYHIHHCEDLLKRSKDITSSIKKQPNRICSQNGNSGSHRIMFEGSMTRTSSPTSRNTSRKLIYDTSASEQEPPLTDRTNDTMADLNVTFPTDQSDECHSFNVNDTVINQMTSKEVTVVHRSPALGARAASPPDRKAQNTTNIINNQANATFICNPTQQQRAAASTIVAYARGYLVRRLLRTERVQATVQTIRDALLCALQLHQDRGGIRGADVDLHRRLIQQITAACYALHDSFIGSSPAERCALIAADRARRRLLAARPPSLSSHRQNKQDLMTQSYSGAVPTRAKRSPPALMTQSNYETFSTEKPCYSSSRRYMPSPRRRPWR